MNFLKEFEKLKIGSVIPIEMTLYISRLPSYKIKHKTFRYDINYGFFMWGTWENGKDGFYYNGNVHIPTYTYYIIKMDDISNIIEYNKNAITFKLLHEYSYIFKRKRYFKIPNTTHEKIVICDIKEEFDIFLNQLSRNNKLTQLNNFYDNDNNR